MKAVKEGRLAEVPQDVIAYVVDNARWFVRHRFRDEKKLAKDGVRRYAADFKEILPDRRLKGPVTRMHREREAALLEKAIQSLSPREKRIIELRRGDASYDEIARELGIGEASARQMQWRIREKILRELAATSPTVERRLREKGAARAAGKPPPTPKPEEIRRFCEANLPPEMRDAVLPLHYGGKGFPELARELGEEVAQARLDGAYQILSRRFGTDFPDAFDNTGAQP
jgi:RNA polymerase sigma factor (sigma-70 family)